jgi:signal transduction histidine kinase
MLKALILRSNAYALTLLATVVVVLASVGLAAGIRLLQSGHVPWRDLMMSFLIPTLVAPGFLFALIRLILRQEQLKAELLARTQALEASNEQTSQLLSHVKQAVFSVDTKLKVSGAFSQSCSAVFGGAPTGQAVADLLCPQAPAAAASLQACLLDALAEPDMRRKALFTSLAPAECQRAGRVLRPDIVPLSQGFMFVVSDVTDQRALEEDIERQQHRLELLLSALTGGEEFHALLDAFKAFIHQGASAWLKPPDDGLEPHTELDLAGLYRGLHTFKGTMSHLGFHHLPLAFHAAEEALRDHGQWGPAAKLAALHQVFATDWAALLEADLAPVHEVLGKGFTKHRLSLALEPQEVEALEGLVQAHLERHPDSSPVLQGLARLNRVHLLTELKGQDRALQRQASQLGKRLQPLRVEGEDLPLYAPQWRPWLSSLVHLFRNAVDHGIEDPDTRAQQGKPEAGTIRCTAVREAGHFTLQIEDDGAGIDEAALREAAARKGLFSAEQAACLGLQDLLFAEGLSSREQANQWSGRGVGMSAVRLETERLGGQIQVINRPAVGCAISLRMPLEAARPK